ncbi:MAG: hypothetical protein KDF67_17095 [Ottowia sp.]|nr:hypothetical protein [Ottowia sp.]
MNAAALLKHPWWSDPQRNDKWEVIGHDSHGRACTSAVYVAARSHSAAVATGKYWLRVALGKRPRSVSARRWHPEHDRELLACGYVQAMPVTTERAGVKK